MGGLLGLRMSKKTTKSADSNSQIIAMLVILVAIAFQALWIYLASVVLNNKTVEPEKISYRTTSVDLLPIRFTAPDGSFSVNFPSAPTQTTNEGPGSSAVTNNIYDAANQASDTRYSVQVFQYPAYTNYMKDNQRQILEQLMQQINNGFTANITNPPNGGQYMCGHSAWPKILLHQERCYTTGTSSGLSALQHLLSLLVYGQNTDTFKSFVSSVHPKRRM